MQAWAQGLGPRAEVGEQTLASLRGTEQSHVGNARRGEAPQVLQIRRQVVTHDHRRGEMRHIGRRQQLVRARQDDAFRGGKVIRLCIRRPMIHDGHLPALARGEIDDRRCVRSGTQKQQPGRKRQRQSEQLPVFSCDRLRPPAVRGVLQRGP